MLTLPLEGLEGLLWAHIQGPWIAARTVVRICDGTEDRHFKGPSRRELFLESLLLCSHTLPEQKTKSFEAGTPTEGWPMRAATKSLAGHEFWLVGPLQLRRTVDGLLDEYTRRLDPFQTWLVVLVDWVSQWTSSPVAR